MDIFNKYYREIDENIRLFYTFDLIDEDTDEIIPKPYWIKFNKTEPIIVINAPLNITDIEPAYGFKIIAESYKDDEELIEEDLILIISKKCFHRCTVHWGTACEDWEMWTLMTVTYVALSFIVGMWIHGCCQIYSEYQINSKRKVRIYRESEQLKFLNNNDDDNDYNKNDVIDTGDAIYVGKRRKPPRDLAKIFDETLWYCWMKCCCLRTR